MNKQERVFALYREGKSFFLTGKAGTGKSTLLKKLRDEDPGLLVVAPTGMAAINVGGTTIHSAFRINPKIFDPTEMGEMYGRGADALRYSSSIVVDEVSMVRGDLLNLMDHRLREVMGEDIPFGGKQMVLIGDLHQLPPVVGDPLVEEYLYDHYGGPYFFLHPSIREVGFSLVELDHVYRQSDPKFLRILNAIRSGDDEGLRELNLRVGRPDEQSVVLTSTNALAAKLNEDRLAELDGEPYMAEARVSGKFPENAYPTEQFLVLKRGARVMTVCNGAGFVNGSLGIVEDFDDLGVRVRFDGAGVGYVERHTWENVSYVVERGEGFKMKIKSEIVGTFTQFPLRLAYAMTAHKSQGQTFDNVHVDLGRGAFAHGQTYVALSRCRTLEGMTLERPVTTRDIQIDPQMLTYPEYFRDRY